MNIKSLLLGSAAALLAVSGARAADAIVVAEPEPAEYVRICDVYGAGYFYIPGTETCLRIGGMLRYDIGFGDLNGMNDVNDVRGDGTNDTWNKKTRAELRFYTAQETELGTLRTYVNTRFEWGTSNVGGFAEAGRSDGWLKYGYVELGGLRIGKDESAFVTFGGYAGNVIADSLVGYGGGFDTNLISYTFDAGNGFSAIVSLEQGSDYGLNSGFDVHGTIDDYVPHVVAGVKYTQGWGGIAAVVGYDSAWEEFTGKVRLDVNATEQLTLWVMGGYGTTDNSTGTDDPYGISNGHNFYKNWDGNWAVWGGGTFQFNEKTAFNLAVGYDEGETLGIAANIDYTIVPGFRVVGEVDYLNVDNTNTDSQWFGSADDDAFGGAIRFQRDF